jgi:uncharacterized protein RhaS with RHS repeats
MRGYWLNRDPIGLAGGMNLYGYVGNNPISFVDPLGLETAVVIETWRDGSINFLGHAAIATTGEGVFSFGTGTDYGSSFTDFIKSQDQSRNLIIYLLQTAPAQEVAINKYLNGMRSKSMPDAEKHPVEGSDDNCATRSNNALKLAGIDLGDIHTPKGLQDALEKLVTGGQATVAPIPQNAAYVPPFLQTFNPKK